MASQRAQSEPGAIRLRWSIRLLVAGIPGVVVALANIFVDFSEWIPHLVLIVVYGLTCIVLSVGGLSLVWPWTPADPDDSGSPWKLPEPRLRDLGCLGMILWFIYAYSIFPVLLLVAGISLSNTLAFAALCSQLYLQRGGFSGVAGGGAAFGPWWDFAWSWLLDNGLFNLGGHFQTR